jgi:hypothetical protein
MSKYSKPEGYESVFLSNESIPSKRHRIGDTIKMRVTDVMDDGVQVMCAHGGGKPPMKDMMKEMGDSAGEKYREAMGGDMED